jgi:plasmid stabilization system protein ParE
MIGLTLSPEQIRAAPQEVRRWLEQQIAATLGLGATQPQSIEPHPHLVECEPQVIHAILTVIQTLPPVLQVFFDLAREPAAVSPPGIRVLRIDDIMRHCHLQAPDQVTACLETINQALRRVAGNPDLAVTALDAAGHCLIADATARNILTVWQDMIGAHRLDTAPALAPAGPPMVFTSPYAMSIPSSEVHPGKASGLS